MERWRHASAPPKARGERQRAVNRKRRASRFHSYAFCRVRKSKWMGASLVPAFAQQWLGGGGRAFGRVEVGCACSLTNLVSRGSGWRRHSCLRQLGCWTHQQRRPCYRKPKLRRQECLRHPLPRVTRAWAARAGRRSWRWFRRRGTRR